MINVSIVLYKHKLQEINNLVETLKTSNRISQVFLIDNSPTPTSDFQGLSADKITYIFNNKNLGYGAAHNIALQKTIAQNIDYHLVINPDIQFEVVILEKMENFMAQNSDIGLLSPKILYPNGETQCLCKLLPTPFDLIFRRFLPKNWTKKRNDFFEMRFSGYNKTMNIPYLSGCFMFLKMSVLKEVGLFDERFFLYPEDIDLTRRIHQKFRTVFYPEVSVIHAHERASYKNAKMLWVHIVNMYRYFNKWGWLFDSERQAVNKKCISLYKNF